jgi:hypothetical protein
MILKMEVKRCTETLVPTRLHCVSNQKYEEDKLSKTFRESLNETVISKLTDMKSKTGKILGSHGGDYDDGCLLGCCAM